MYEEKGVRDPHSKPFLVGSRNYLTKADVMITKRIKRTKTNALERP
jgi:hypothetical protein